jgi:peptide/nickel transport system substrate-binding protein
VTSTLTDENVTTFENFPPIGAGPYTVTEWVPGSSITFDGNPTYHRGKPPIDRIVLQIFTNTDALVNSLIAGDIDMTTLLSGDYVETMKQTPNIAIYAEPPRQKYELEFNVASAGKKHAAIDDPAVREAIDYSINRQQILDVALLGYGELCPTNWACRSVSPDQVNPELAVTPYDPDHAKQILEAAGYRDADGDGILETAAGEPLQFRLAYESADPVELTIADMITADMKEIGIGTEIEAVEAGMVNDLLNGRDFDLLIYGMYTDVFAPIQLNWTSTCAAAEAKASGHNFPGFCNAEFDELVGAAYAALDKETLQEALFSAEKILYDERPFIVLAAMTGVQGVRSDRFEFPNSEYCQLSSGALLFTDVLMNAVVK